MFLLGNLGQQMDIHDTQQALRDLALEAERAARSSDRASHSVGELARENAELKLYLVAVTRLLVAKGIISPRELADIVDAVDRSDGTSDGGYSGPIAPPS